MKCTPTAELPDVLIIEPDVFGDSRGYFMETYRASRYHELGLPAVFVQDNCSFSARGVLRGMHYQLERPQGKLVSVAVGEILDVAVDVRRGSPTFGKWTGVALSADNHRQLYIPEGFAHGFGVMSETALVQYKCTDYYDPPSERGLIWSDPQVGIEWGIGNPAVSDKDGRYPVLADIPENDLPLYNPSSSG